VVSTLRYVLRNVMMIIKPLTARRAPQSVYTHYAVYSSACSMHYSISDDLLTHMQA